MKHQPTLPKKIREKLGVGLGDVLQWDLAYSRAFLDLRGSFKVGPGDPVEDVRRARERMGMEGS